jgi:hypothetical protein
MLPIVTNCYQLLPIPFILRLDQQEYSNFLMWYIVDHSFVQLSDLCCSEFIEYQSCCWRLDERLAVQAVHEERVFAIGCLCKLHDFESCLWNNSQIPENIYFDQQHIYWLFFYIQFHLNQHIQNSVNQLDMNLNNSYLNTNWGFRTKGDPQSSPIPSTRHDRAEQLPLGWVAPVGSQCERSAEDVGKSDPGDLWSRLVGFLKGDQCFCWLDFLDLARDLVGHRKKL